MEDKQGEDAGQEDEEAEGILPLIQEVRQKRNDRYTYRESELDGDDHSFSGLAQYQFFEKTIMDSDGSVGSKSHKERSDPDHEHIKREQQNNLPRNAHSPRYVLAFFSAIVVGNVRHDHVPK